MGAFRFLLALSVAFFHLHQNEKIVLDGYVAVQCFFLISGFYIFKTWEQQFATLKKPILKFYKSRFLRIYPLYWCSFAALLSWSLISHYWYPENHNRLGPILFFIGKLSSLESLDFLFANFFILGLDWFYFIGFNSIGHFVFSKTIQGAQELIILRPAWSLSIEMLFYLLTPFLVKLKKHLLLLVLLVLLLLRFLAYQKGYNGINWMYQFFPFELALFLLGGLAYQLSKTVTNNLASYSNYFYFSLLLSFPLLAFIPFNAYTCWGYYAFVCFVLVFANQAPKKFNRFDLFLGQLSFPIYLIHIVAIIMVEDIFKTNNPVLFLLVLILLTIPLFFLQKKINSLRSLIQK